MKLCMEEPPRTLDLGETGFGVGHLGLVTTCLSWTLVVTVAEQQLQSQPQNTRSQYLASRYTQLSFPGATAGGC